VDEHAVANAGPLPYQQAIEVVIAALRTEPDGGLNLDEARARLARDGPNELTADAPQPVWRKLLVQF
jgi:P-type Ca2+ transporter type 2C